MAAWYKEKVSFGPRNIFLTELIHCKYKNNLVGCLVTTDELCPVALYNIKLVFNSTLKFSSQSRPYSTTSSTLSPVNVEWDIIRFPQCEVSKGANPPPPCPKKEKSGSGHHLTQRQIHLQRREPLQKSNSKQLFSVGFSKTCMI